LDGAGSFGNEPATGLAIAVVWGFLKLRRWLMGPSVERTPPLSTFAGIVTLLIVLGVGIGIMTRNATGHDPFEDWAGPLLAFLASLVALHEKAEHGLPRPYASVLAAVILGALAMQMPEPHWRFFVATAGTGTCLLLDGVLLARALESERKGALS
jgi:hypothetical protein